MNQNHLILLLLCFWLWPTHIEAQQFSHQTQDDYFEQVQAGNADLPPEDAKRLGGQELSNAFAISTSQKINACGTPFNLVSLYNSNNGQRGCMFDVFAVNSVVINCFDANLYAGTTANYEIYYRTGTHVGNETNAAAWTLLGTVTGLTSTGANLPTPIPITFNVNIPAGATYAFYITNDFGGGLSYTDGTSIGNLLANDANLIIREGVGKSYPFGLTFSVRNFNGTAYYGSSGPLDGQNVALVAQTQNGHVRLDWKGRSHVGQSAQVLQRSVNGIDFTDLYSNSNWTQPAAYLDWDVAEGSTYYYRLQNFSANGDIQFSEIVSILLPENEAFFISNVKPNPFSGQLSFNLLIEDDSTTLISFVDATGRLVLQQQLFHTRGLHPIKLNTNPLSSGLYSLIVQNGKHRQIRKLVHL